MCVALTDQEFGFWNRSVIQAKAKKRYCWYDYREDKSKNPPQNTPAESDEKCYCFSSYKPVVLELSSSNSVIEEQQKNPHWIIDDSPFGPGNGQRSRIMGRFCCAGPKKTTGKRLARVSLKQSESKGSRSASIPPQNQRKRRPKQGWRRSIHLTTGKLHFAAVQEVFPSVVTPRTSAPSEKQRNQAKHRLREKEQDSFNLKNFHPPNRRSRQQRLQRLGHHKEEMRQLPEGQMQAHPRRNSHHHSKGGFRSWSARKSLRSSESRVPAPERLSGLPDQMDRFATETRELIIRGHPSVRNNVAEVEALIIDFVAPAIDLAENREMITRMGDEYLIVE